MTGGLLDAARAWAEDDPDPQTRADLLALVTAAAGGDARALEELEDAFSGPLDFGPTGMAGRLGPGPRRMNRVVVARAAAGLAAYLLDRSGGTVVVGYDGRRYSGLFAKVVAQVLSGAGLPALVLPGPLPTPVLAFAVRHLGATAGVMATGSHEPSADNGLRVYLGDGAPVGPPADAEITAHIARMVAEGPAGGPALGQDWQTLDDQILEDYVARTVSVLEDGPMHHLRVAYTPLHGVAGEVLLRLFRAASFPAPLVVAEQAEPDPDFPTLSLPPAGAPPERPPALDRVIALAEAEDADLVLAHDPAGERLAVGVRDGDGWRVLSGDEVGWLLGWWVASGNRRLARRGVFGQSVASGSMLARIARDFHLDFEETPSGFCWLGRVPDLMFGYEESRSYCVDPIGVRDRDGISAALMVAEMASRLQRMERTVLDMLDDLERTYGAHATGTMTGPEIEGPQVAATLAALRDGPPDRLGGLEVLRVDDLALLFGPEVPVEGLRLTLAGGGRVVVRPGAGGRSLVAHLQCVVEPGEDGLGAARSAAAEHLRTLRTDLARWLG